MNRKEVLELTRYEPKRESTKELELLVRSVSYHEPRADAGAVARGSSPEYRQKPICAKWTIP